MSGTAGWDASSPLRCDDRPMEPLVVRLRPFEERDLWYFDRAATDREFSAPFEWGGFRSPESWRRRWREEGLLGATPYCLAVAAVDDDSLVGLVDWGQNERWGAGVWEIGALIVPEHRGRGRGNRGATPTRRLPVLDHAVQSRLGGHRGGEHRRAARSRTGRSRPRGMCARSALPRRPMAGQLHLWHHAQRLDG